MRSMNAFRWLAAAGALMLSSLAPAQVRISEIHYDNAGADVGEAIEVSAPAGTNLSGWNIVLYNGANGASYDTDPLPATVTATCGARGVVVINYPVNGIQNGSPDAIALVDASNNVVEYLSYEGVFAATNGPAAGLTSTDIGALQNGNGLAGESLQRNAAGVWALGTSTFGACNDAGDQPPPPEIVRVDVVPMFSTIDIGGSLPFSATAFGEGNVPVSGTPLTWSSSNTSIATVSATGVVTGVAFGDAVISAAAINGISGAALARIRDLAPEPTTEFHINEIHYDNAGVDAGEAIEIEGPSGASVEGFSIVLYNGNGGVTYGTPTALHGTLPASCGARGVVFVTYPTDGIQNGPDGIALVDAANNVIEYVSYEGFFSTSNGPAAGLTPIDIGAQQSNAPIGTSLQRSASGVWASSASTFGACNSDAPPPPPRSILLTGRTPADAPLPVGYEDQLFAQLRENGSNVPSTFTWTSETPSVATIDADGVFRALTAGSATFRATAADGTTSTITLPTHVAVASGTAQYANNAEFGEPFDGDPSDDFIVHRPQYTSSYSSIRNSANWVAYEIEATHFGSEDRCDCFTMDPGLPSSYLHIDTNDYTGAGAAAGYGIDRGHLARSFDRTSGSLDNATTFLLSNIIPQAADQNQGPWAQLENDLGDFARTQNREVYVITGVYGNKGTLKGEGKVTIPTHTWKVALVLPRNQGLADIRDYRDILQTVAVIMPNEPGIRNVPWQTYLTTVDEIELRSGYDLLALLPDAIEAAIESGTQPPIGAIAGPAGAISEGDSATFSASGSLDPNGSIVGYIWDFGDGTSGSGVSVTHTFAQDGVFTVRLTLTDNDDLTSTTTFSVTVTNVLPTVGAVPSGAVNVGVVYTASGTFADPGADNWSATVNWGDGSASETVSLAGKSFALSHTFAAAGAYTVSIAISDDDGSSAVAHTVTVAQPAPGLGAALPLIDQLVAAGKLPRAVGLVFKAQILIAQQLIQRGQHDAAEVLVRALVIEIDLLGRLKVIKAADVAPLRTLLVQVIASL